MVFVRNTAVELDARAQPRIDAILSPVRLALGLALGALPATAWGQTAQQAPADSQTIVVTGSYGGYAVPPAYSAPKVHLGPLGDTDPQDTPASVTIVTEGLIVNNQARTVNDTLRYLPSVQVRDQQGLEVSRPQSRGFQGSIVQDTRLDGLNIVSTTAIPADNLQGVQVLNGLAGVVYGPQPPAGVFDYRLKRPTDHPLLRALLDYDQQGVFTGQIDASHRFGPMGVRLNAVHGEGEGIVDGSHQNRTLVAADVDLHLNDSTVLEIDGSHYQTQAYGLAGAIIYFNPPNVLLPRAIDPTRAGYGQPGAGTDLRTDTGLAKIRHDLGGGWTVQVGGLYQNADRGLFGITNTLRDNTGNYTVTKNFNAVSRFTVASNSASITGPVTIFGLRNDLALGTNGFVNGQYNNRNPIAVNLGSGSLSNPRLLPSRPTPDTGGRYKSGQLFVQTVVVGDTIHFDPQWALQTVLSSSFLKSMSYNARGLPTSRNVENGLWSPTVSLTYKPLANLTLYATFADSVEQGESAPAGTANANTILPTYRDYQYEAGAKWAPVSDFLVTAAGFRMTRPLAETDPATNLFEVVGRQRNWGGELFGQGAVSPALSLLGGATYIDARLTRSILPGTDGGRVVGVPRFKSDVTADLHPAFAGGVALTGSFHYESDRAATNLNNSFAPAYATVDLGLRYTAHLFGHGEIARLNIINVGNKRYFSSIADGNIVGSPGANTAYSGAPRTVLASFEFEL